jgi:hypothetical protein
VAVVPETDKEEEEEVDEEEETVFGVLRRVA